MANKLMICPIKSNLKNRRNYPLQENKPVLCTSQMERENQDTKASIPKTWIHYLFSNQNTFPESKHGKKRKKNSQRKKKPFQISKNKSKKTNVWRKKKKKRDHQSGTIKTKIFKQKKTWPDSKNQFHSNSKL